MTFVLADLASSKRIFTRHMKPRIVTRTPWRVDRRSTLGEIGAAEVTGTHLCVLYLSSRAVGSYQSIGNRKEESFTNLLYASVKPHVRHELLRVATRDGLAVTCSGVCIPPEAVWNEGAVTCYNHLVPVYRCRTP